MGTHGLQPEVKFSNFLAPQISNAVLQMLDSNCILHFWDRLGHAGTLLEWSHSTNVLAVKIKYDKALKQFIIYLEHLNRSPVPAMDLKSSRSGL